VTPIDERFVPARRGNVHAVEIDDEAVLLDEANGRLHLLNATGAMVWWSFDGAATVADIADELSDAFGVSRDRVVAESLAIVQRLVAEGLVTDAGSR
jgi:hypothetical protein